MAIVADKRLADPWRIGEQSSQFQFAAAAAIRITAIRITAIRITAIRITAIRITAIRITAIWTAGVGRIRIFSAIITVMITVIFAAGVVGVMVRGTTWDMVHEWLQLGLVEVSGIGTRGRAGVAKSRPDGDRDVTERLAADNP